MTVNRLRKKLPGLPVKTIYGVGYTWRNDDDLLFTAFFAAAALFSPDRRRSSAPENAQSHGLSSTLDRISHRRHFSESRFSKKKLSAGVQNVPLPGGGRNRAKRVTEEKNAVKTLVSDISHQTKTPIRIFCSILSFLAETPEMNRDMKNLVTQIEDQTENSIFSSPLSSRPPAWKTVLSKLSRKENTFPNC